MIRSTVKNLVDDLTGALTRGAIYSLIAHEVKRIKRYGGKTSLLFVDLDNFKAINDLYGHLEGDKTLVKLVQFLKKTLRESDTIVRYGGDEFIIVLPNTPMEKAERVADRIIKCLRNEDLNISCSIGIVEIPTHGTNPEILIEKADKAMYKAKEAAKGKFFTYIEDSLNPQIPSKVFIGRKEEKATLHSLLNQNYPVILIKGELGIGKTRFSLESLNSLEGLNVLPTQCYGSLTPIPYVPFLELIKRYRESNEIRFKEIYSKMDPFQKQALNPIIPYLGQSPPAEVEVYKFFETFIQLLAEIAEREKTTCLFIDDIQWMDESSIKLMTYIARNIPKNIKFILAARSEELNNSEMNEVINKLHNENLLTIMELPPLNEEAAYELIESILQAPVKENLKKLIYRKSGRNPLFIEEIIRQLFDMGSIVFEEGEWIIKEANIIILPETVETLIKNKLKKYIDEKVLEIAAIIGQEFHVDIIANVANLNKGHVYDTINKLLKDNLIEQKEEDYFAFKEGLIRDAILSEISEAKKRYLSKMLLNVLEKQLPSFAGKEELCAYHAYLCQDKEKTKLYSKLAYEKLKKIYAYDECIKLLQWYIEVEDNEIEREKAFNEYVTLLAFRGELKKAIKLLLEYIDNNKVTALSYRTLAELLIDSGDPNGAYNAIEKSLEIEESPESIVLKAWILRKKFKIWESYNLLKDLLSKKDLKIDEKTLGDAYNVQALNLMDLNKIEKAFEFFDRAQEIRTNLQDIKGVGSVHLNRAIAVSRLEKHEEALKEIEIAESCFKKTGYKRGVIIVLNNKAGTYLELRKFQEALENYKKAAKESKKIFDRHLLALALNNISETLLHLEYPREALNYLHEAHAIASELEMKDILITLKSNMAYCYAIGFKNLEKAIPLIKEVLREIEEPQKSYESLQLYLEAIEIFIIAKDFDKVKKLLESLDEVIESTTYDDIKINLYSIEMAFNWCFRQRESFENSSRKVRIVLKKVDPYLRSILRMNFLEGLSNIFSYLGKSNISLKILDYLIRYCEKNSFTEDIDRIKRKMERMKRLFPVEFSLPKQ